MRGFNAWEDQKREEADFKINMIGLAEFVLKMLGYEPFYKNFPTLKRQSIKEAIKNSKCSAATANLIKDTFYDEWHSDYENYDPTKYIPLGDREPLTFDFIRARYWMAQKTTLEIADELNVPEYWVQKEIRRLGMQKKENGIFLKGKKGYKMSEEEKVKHQNQPHAKPIVQICPKSFTIIKEYNSQGAVERYGFKRENVRKAIKSGGISKGYLWAFKDLAEVTIRVAKKRGTLDRKLQAYEYEKPSKALLEKNLYYSK